MALSEEAGALGRSLAEGPFTGPTAFADLIRNALLRANNEAWSEMVWSDATFEDWPLYEKTVVEGLNAWSRKGRKRAMRRRGR